jgi:hypothetical protein
MSVMLAYAFASPTSSRRASSAPDAADFGVANGLEGLDVEAGIEAAADETNAERNRRHDRPVRRSRE